MRKRIEAEVTPLATAAYACNVTPNGTHIALGASTRLPSPHFSRKKPYQEFDISCHTDAFQRRQVGIASFHAHDGPGITAGCQHDVHQEAPDAAVAVEVGWTNTNR